MLDDFASISVEDKEVLIKIVSKGKIFRTLKSMARGKSPGSDGLTVEFYIFLLASYQ